MIAAVDEFILYDDMQFTKNDWRNRNQIKTPQGIQWLTVPVGQNINRRIRDVSLSVSWQKKHWKTLEGNYRRAPCFDEVAEWLSVLYIESCYSNLSEMNRRFIVEICAYMGITTNIINSWEFELSVGKTERLISICSQAGASTYVSGPAAKNYIEELMFSDKGIELVWFDYAGYPEYPQLWGEFAHGVSILDLLFNCGKDAHRYMKYVTL